METSNGLDFTIKRENAFYNAAELENFKTQEAKVIFNFIKENMYLIPFGDYLKRYIYHKLKLTGDYNSVDISVYQKYIIDSFKETGTPPSFEPTSSKISALAKNWLSQSVVSRKTVLLLGFGLKMTADEVSEFLKKAVQEGDFYFKNPFEIICWYCYKNGFGFDKVQELLNAYEDEVKNFETTILAEDTFGIRQDFQKAGSNRELLDLLKSHHLNVAQTYSFTAKKQFDVLYAECKKIISVYKQTEENWEFENELYDFEHALIKKPYIKSEKKKSLLKSFRGKQKQISAKDVSESDVEKFLCSGTPVDKKGNLTKISVSSLSANFSKKRMSRQHINDIISGKVSVDRFDLITLKFFIVAHNNNYEKNINRWWEFVDETNKMLEVCSMGELYIANPYDCFLQMCMLTDDPLATYDLVIEKSYDSTP